MNGASRHAGRLQLILRNLPHLLAAERAGSLHRAGADLGIAQSALSRRIAEVEAELGAPLFTRRATGVSANAAGAIFLQDIDKITRELDHAIRRFTLNQAGQDRLLRVGFNSAAMMFPAMAQALSACRRLHPQCDLRLGAHLSQAQYALVLAGELDLGIAYLLDEDLPFRHQILATDRLLLALPSDHALAHGPLHLHDIDGLPFIAMQKDTSGLLAAQVDKILSAQGVQPKAVMQAGSSEATLNLVAAGLGLAFVNASQAGRCPPNVVLRDLPGFALPITIAALWRAEAETPLLLSFLSILGAAFAADPVMPKQDHLA